MKPIQYYIAEFRKDTKRTLYVCAPPGFYRKNADGKIARDGTCTLKSGPEWSDQRSHAFMFKSHRAAMRVRNKCGDNAKVHSF